MGLHWKEIEELGLIKDPFSENDKKTLDRLIDESKNERIKQELLIMKKKGYKVEIQALNNISYDYISSYLQKKILKRQYL